MPSTIGQDDAAKTLRLATAAETLRLATAAETLRLATVAETLRLATVAETLRLATVAETLRLATVAPDRARQLAAAMMSEARRRKDWAAVSSAARAAGVAAFQLRDLPSSAAALRVAITAGRRAKSCLLVAEAQMSLAATLVVGGSPNRAIAEIDAALGSLDGLAAARAHVQRATIFQALGRFDEALTEYRVALPVLRREVDVEWQTRALSNRSLLLTSRRSFAAAEADLVAAETLCVQHGLELPAAFAKQNLGCLKAGQGQVIAALELFDAVAVDYRRLGVQVGSLLVDRGELLLSVRLVREARMAAELAVSTLRAQNRRVDIPQALLLLSTAALLDGDPSTALDAARRAARDFARLGRPGGLALARYAQLQAQLQIRPASVGPARARRSAADLLAAGWLMPSLEARVLAGRMALERGNTADARRDLAQASRARWTGPADCRARAWLAEALLRKADGKRRAATLAVSAGLRIVEQHQATLGATELRAHVSAHRGALARLGLRMALEDGSARRVLSWAERGRGSALLMRPPRPPDDGVLAQLFADLRTTMKEIEERLGAGRPSAELVQRQVRLEREVAQRRRILPAEDAETSLRPVGFAEINAAIGSAALIEYLQLDGQLFAVAVAGGRVRLASLGAIEAVGDRMAHLTFALRRLALARTPRSLAAATMVLQTVGAGFDQMLLAPLAGVIGDRPLVVVPTGALQSLPWSVLPSCAGRPLTVAPSATLWCAAARRPKPGPAARIVIVAGPGLPGARAEAEAVAALYPGSSLLVDKAATVNALSIADGAALVHVAAHGSLRADNPFFSSLLMADGPLTVYDLERLPQAPHHVILAACDSARMHLLTGDEVLGFAAALLVQGTTSLVAPVVPVPDAATVALMTSYHRELIAGRPPAEALAAAQQRADSSDPAARAAAAAFICTGAGFVA